MDRARQTGFTLLEVLIAMSILAVGATSVLSIFVWAVSFHTKRVEENRITDLYNHAIAHAQLWFNAFDPSRVQEGESHLPAPIDADLTDPYKARRNKDPQIAEAAEKFPGFRYVITFEDNDLAVSGSSIVANIEIYGLSGRRDQALTHKQFLTRSGAPVTERFKSPSLEKQAAERGRNPGGMKKGRDVGK